jgi:hypothetical protein
MVSVLKELSLRHEDLRFNGVIVPEFLTPSLDGGDWLTSRRSLDFGRERAPGPSSTGSGTRRTEHRREIHETKRKQRKKGLSNGSDE